MTDDHFCGVCGTKIADDGVWFHRGVAKCQACAEGNDLDARIEILTDRVAALEASVECWRALAEAQFALNEKLQEERRRAE